MPERATIEADARASNDGQNWTTLELIKRYYSDRAYRESLPCGECGRVGGCTHFPTERHA